ncbi:MAG: hypothetical protein KF838_12845 [Phycisphaeraceae bacterium]|nr:MAG: hypothetical protein KF838_12845 [Phycisphaeraceae bacterium]
MGASYRLVNLTRRERVEVSGFGVDKAREIVGSHAVSTLVLWYMLSCRGDQIAFVSDYDSEAGRPVFGRSLSATEIDAFTDATESAIRLAVSAGVLVDKGWEELVDDRSIRVRHVEVDHRPGRLPSEGL